MRVVSIVLGLSLLVACSSNNDLASDATGGYPSFGTGGVGSGGFVSSGGSGTSNGGTISSGGFGTGGFGTGGFGAGGFDTGGNGGSLLDAAVDATADAAADGATAPDGAAPDSGAAPTACADPTEKKCSGSCVKPSPANGCSLSVCTACPSVANGVQTCDKTACSFACNPGFKASGGTCISSGSADAGKGSPDNGACTANGDCTSGVCQGGICQAARCNDHVKNGLESDVDCGGNCGPCAAGAHCTHASDCDDGPCQGGVCGCTPHTCNDPALAGRCGDALDDHCGSTTSCGCGSGELCNQAVCCDPQAACQTACGTVTACGESVDCGMIACSPGQKCSQSKCCTPATQCAAGACGTASDGCGGTITCASCPEGRACNASGQCACDGTDTDGDGMTDCAEADDGDPWTDPAIFNGLVGATYDNCNANASCTTVNTNAKVDACMAKTVVETHNLSSGWDFADTSATRCDSSYGFGPDWTKTCNDYTFSVSYTGYINLKAGTNCFDITGTNNDSCGVFFLDGSDATPVTHDSGAKCFDVTTAGAHAVRLFFDRAPFAIFSPVMGFEWTHCFGGASTCKPTTAVTQSELRVKN